MIEIKNLIKKYNNFTALNDISLNIETGKIVGLLGPNGAGKTTLMRIMTGYMAATSGTCTINGVEVHEDSLTVKKSIGYLPENPPLYTELTIREYLRFAGELKGLSGKDLDYQIDSVIDATGLRERVNQIIETLSKGFRQRVGLSMALINDPKLLVLDEPTVGLDPNQILEIRALIKQISEKRTVILSSHILQEISSTCNHIIIINNGTVLANETKDSILNRMGDENQVHVEVEGDNAAAQILLADRFESAQIVGSKIIVKDPSLRTRRSEIAEILVKHDQKVIEIASGKMSLEDIFHKVTLQ